MNSIIYILNYNKIEYFIYYSAVYLKNGKPYPNLNRLFIKYNL